MPPPSPLAALLLLIVLLNRVAVPWLKMPPPSPANVVVVELPATVLLCRVIVPKLWMPPPVRPLLNDTVLLVMSIDPRELEMPPPEPRAVLPVTVLDWSVSEP